MLTINTGTEESRRKRVVLEQSGSFGGSNQTAKKEGSDQPSLAEQAARALINQGVKDGK